MLDVYGSSQPPERSAAPGELIRRQRLVQRLIGLVLCFGGSALVVASGVKAMLSITQGLPWTGEVPLAIAGTVVVSLGIGAGRSRQLALLLGGLSRRARKRRAFVVAVVAVALVACMVGMKLSVGSVSRYKRLLGEGGLIEYGQVLLLAASAWCTALIAKDCFRRLGLRALGTASAVASFGLAFLVMEELAWGQVLFGWQTPEGIANVNAQNQTTFHNLDVFQSSLDVSFFLLMLALLIVIVVQPFGSYPTSQDGLSPKAVGALLLPPRYFWPLGLVSVLISLFVASKGAPTIIFNRDQEWAELVFYLVLALASLRGYILLGGMNRSAE
ncbi:pectate lyase [Synechococcus sp. RSCCF101]|uniref:pectate lyase n=1 Tax=Synechococcus sp. RSCCF101 TaxID=2511069 RepID=UPI001243A824|nr:pectate lyase [Synechococcus sp. RSCCF101]QEY32896.1 pectate lyase [Synechococcus sp. RSCCF101]